MTKHSSCLFTETRVWASWGLAQNSQGLKTSLNICPPFPGFIFKCIIAKFLLELIKMKIPFAISAYEKNPEVSLVFGVESECDAYSQIKTCKS